MDRIQSGSGSPSSALPKTATWLPIGIRDSGSRWIRCATEFTSKSCGRTERLGNAGENIRLAGRPIARKGPHRIQGRLVFALAASPRRESYGFLPPCPDRAEPLRTDAAHRA